MTDQLCNMAMNGALADIVDTTPTSFYIFVNIIGGSVTVTDGNTTTTNVGNATVAFNVTSGENATISITYNTNAFTVDGFTVDGVNTTFSTNTTFTAVGENHYISATIGTQLVYELSFSAIPTTNATIDSCTVNVSGTAVNVPGHDTVEVFGAQNITVTVSGTATLGTVYADDVDIITMTADGSTYTGTFDPATSTYPDSLLHSLYFPFAVS